MNLEVFNNYTWNDKELHIYSHKILSVNASHIDQHTFPRFFQHLIQYVTDYSACLYCIMFRLLEADYTVKNTC